MTTYVVEWRIEIDAASPREAAEIARIIQLDPSSTATVFNVINGEEYEDFKVDLMEDAA